MVNPPGAGFLQRVVSWAQRGPQVTRHQGWSQLVLPGRRPLASPALRVFAPLQSWWFSGRMLTSSRGELTVALKVVGVVLIGPEVTAQSPRSGGDTHDQGRPVCPASPLLALQRCW